MNARVILILILIVLAEVYSGVLVSAIVKDLPVGWKLSLVITYVVFTLICWVAFLLMRQMSNYDIPHAIRNLLIAFTMGVLIGKLLIMTVMLIDDLRRVVLLGVHYISHLSSANGDTESFQVSRSFFLKRTALVLAGLSISGFLLGMRNRYNYAIRRISLQFPGLPGHFKGLRIVQLSDIHTGSFDNHQAVELGIKKALALQPDIIFFTGDLVNNAATEIDQKYQSIFAMLKAPLGVYSVLGNHDYGDYMQWPTSDAKTANLNALKDIQAKAGWKLLLNEHLILEKEGARIGLVGIENWGAKANFSRYGDMKKACAGLLPGTTHFNILLSHDPSHWDAQVRKDYPHMDLTLSGHTHGMQFGIDSKFLKWSPVQYLYKQWGGLYQEAHQYLYVNRGFGFIGYPGRIGIWPEITCIDIN